jgi:hypothetical protein
MEADRISYDEVAYVNYLRKLERRVFAKPIIRKWCKICMDEQSNLITSELESLETSLMDVGKKLGREYPDEAYIFAKHRAEIKDKMEKVLVKKTQKEKRYYRDRAKFVEKAESEIHGENSENIRIESRLMKMYGRKVSQELTSIHQKIHDIGREWFSVPVKGEAKKLVDKIHIIESEQKIANNVIRQKKLWGKVSADHLLDYLSPEPYIIKNYTLRLLSAILEFTSSEEDRDATFVTTVDGKRAFLNFVKDEAHFSIGARSVYDRIIRCFAQLDDIFDDREIEKPEFNTSWFFDRRSQIVRLKYDVEHLLKIGSIRLE